MPHPTEDVPQTAAEARSFGWTWIEVRCLGCKHRRQMRFDDLVIYRPRDTLGSIATKLRCSQCEGRALEFELGMYLTEDRTTFSHRRAIAFEHGRAVRPER